MTHLTGGTIPEARIRTFIREGNRMIEYLAARTHLRFDSLESYPDYVPEDPGGRLGGRSLDPVPFDGNELGEEFRTLHDPYPAGDDHGQVPAHRAAGAHDAAARPQAQARGGEGHGALRGAVPTSPAPRSRPVPDDGPVAHGSPAPLAHRARRPPLAALAGRVVRRGGRSRGRRADHPRRQPDDDRGATRRDGRRRRVRAQRRDAQEVPAGADRGELDGWQLRQHR